MMNLLIVAIQIDQKMKWDSYKHWISQISTKRQEKISRFKFDIDKIRSLTGELVARKYISMLHGIPLRAIQFYEGKHGKPFVKDIPVHVNWSHSGDWVLFAIDKKSVGIDVEIIHQVKELKLAKHYFAPQEIAQLERLGIEERKNHFFRLWSLKESYIKWKGTGLYTSLDSFRFVYNADNELIFTNNHGDSCYFQKIFLDARHHAAVCTSRKNTTIEIKKVSLDSLLSSINEEFNLI